MIDNLIWFLSGVLVYLVVSTICRLFMEYPVMMEDDDPLHAKFEFIKKEKK